MAVVEQRSEVVSKQTPDVMSVLEEEEKRVTIQLKDEEGKSLGAPFDVQVGVTSSQLQKLCNSLLNLDDPVPCSFHVQDAEINDTLIQALNIGVPDKASEPKKKWRRKDAVEPKKPFDEYEKVLEILYQPQAVFRVQAVTRCTSSLPGHGEAVISAQFSPDGKNLASGSGDTTVRFWDLTTELPLHTCEGHAEWVLCIAWSPDGLKLASACRKGQIRIWDPESGTQVGHILSGHKKWITCLCWEPIHQNADCRYLASSSKDTDIRIWDTTLGKTVKVLAGHTSCVTWLRWGGEGLLYSSSQDRTIKVWRASDGVLCRTLQGHGHWVNTMALNTDYVLRTGAFEPENLGKITGEDLSGLSKEAVIKKAKLRYDKAKGDGAELLVSGSDDFTLFLWKPSTDKKPLCRMTGHMQLVNQVVFSPDARLIASASFDKSVKLWCGRTGKFLSTFRGHVQAVYQVAWSADSRLLVSGSADSTLKVWNVSKRALSMDLPGHADEVYAVDWSPDGQRVVSGGKDKVLKLWRR